MAEEVTPPARRWVDVAVVQKMLGIGLQQAYRLAREEGWRRKPATRPRQWALDDVHRTWLARNTNTEGPTHD